MFEGLCLGARLAEAFYVVNFSCSPELLDAKGRLPPSAITRVVPPL